MRIELMKIRQDAYSELKNTVDLNYDFYLDSKNDKIIFNQEEVNISSICETVSNDSIDLEYGDLEFSSSIMKWKENYLVGKLLYTKLLSFSNKSYGVLHENSFWAYLCLQPILKDYIIKRFITNCDDDEKYDDTSESGDEKTTSKIQRYLLQNEKFGQVTRNGLMFDWLLTDCLYDNKKQFEFCEVAFSFIDCVKGIYERSFSKNKWIVKAFVEGIINNNKSMGFKDPKYRTLIPTHISNIASINMLDSYDDYDELVRKVTKEQSIMLRLYNESKKNI